MTVSDAKTHCQEDREANEANETMSYSNQIAKYCAMNIQEDRGTCRCYGVCKQQEANKNGLWEKKFPTKKSLKT
jgi:hypothetical protein